MGFFVKLFEKICVWFEIKMVLFVRLTLRLKFDTRVTCGHECGRKY